MGATTHGMNWARLSKPHLFMKDLEVDGTFYADGAVVLGTDLDIAGTLEVTDNTTLRGTLSVAKVGTFASDLHAVGKLQVTDNTTLRGTLAVTKAITAASDLHVAGDLDVTDAALVRGALDVVGTLGVTDNATLRGTLVVTKVGTFASDLHAVGKLQVTDATTLRSTLAVTGVGTFASDLHAVGKLQVTDAVTLRGTLAVTGVGTFASDLHAVGTLQVTDAVTFRGSLAVTGPGTFNSDLHVVGDLDVTDDALVRGTLTVSESIRLAGGVILSLTAAANMTDKAGYGVIWGTTDYTVEIPATDFGLKIAGILTNGPLSGTEALVARSHVAPVVVGTDGGAITVGAALRLNAAGKWILATTAFPVGAYAIQAWKTDGGTINAVANFERSHL